MGCLHRKVGLMDCAMPSPSAVTCLGTVGGRHDQDLGPHQLAKEDISSGWSLGMVRVIHCVRPSKAQIPGRNMPRSLVHFWALTTWRGAT